ncbi:transposable element Tcb1 transposase [Trichonephila clavipes]|nr:transposable element Tcb1 transposase [Trichonephila clavipes]
MVWSVIAYDIRSPLILINCSMTAHRYVHDIIQPHVFPLMARLLGPIFELETQEQATHSKDVTRLPPPHYHPFPPARSPELTPIEHIWDNLERQVGLPTSLVELEARLQKLWKEMSQAIIRNLCVSMSVRITSNIRARGGPTEY